MGSHPLNFVVSLWRRKTRFFIFLGVVLLIFAGLSVVAIENYRLFFGMYHDDSIYLVSAKSLADGLGYKIISLPGDPVQSKYPIGFPLYLAAFWKLFPQFPQNLLPIEIAQTVVGAAACIVSTAYLIATRKITWLIGAVIVAACLFNQRYIDVAPMILSDFMCALLAAIALWRTEVLLRSSGFRSVDARIDQSVHAPTLQIQGAPSKVQWILLGILWSLPLFIRVQGIIAAAACFIFLVLHKRYKGALIAGLVSAAIIIPEIAWQGFNAAHSSSFIGFYTGYLPTDRHGAVSLTKFFDIMHTSNTWGHFIQVGTFFPFLLKIPFSELSPVMYFLIYRLGYFVLELPFLFGALIELRRVRLPGLYCLLYTLPLLLVPVRIEFRQILPVLPFTYYFFLQGFRLIARWLKPQDILLRNAYTVLCSGIFTVLAVYLIFGGMIESLQRSDFYENTLRRNAPRYSPQAGNTDYAEAFYWVENNTTTADVFLCNSDPLFYLYTGRKAMQPWKVDMFSIVNEKPPPPDAMLDAIRYSRAKYIMVDPLFRGLGKGPSPADFLVICLSLRYPGSISPVFRSSHGLIHIWEIHPRLAQ
jgi:hypothetical protein